MENPHDPFPMDPLDPRTPGPHDPTFEAPFGVDYQPPDPVPVSDPTFVQNELFDRAPIPPWEFVPDKPEVEATPKSDAPEIDLKSPDLFETLGRPALQTPPLKDDTWATRPAGVRTRPEPRPWCETYYGPYDASKMLPNRGRLIRPRPKPPPKGKSYPAGASKPVECPNCRRKSSSDLQLLFDRYEACDRCERRGCNLCLPLQEAPQSQGWYAYGYRQLCMTCIHEVQQEINDQNMKQELRRMKWSDRKNS